MGNGRTSGAPRRLPGPAEHLFFPGVINDVAIYDAGLDAHTIQSHYLTMMTGHTLL